MAIKKNIIKIPNIAPSFWASQLSKMPQDGANVKLATK